MTPADAKALGDRIEPRFDWTDELALKIMEEVVLAKFNAHEDLARKLIETSPSELIEGNTWGDTFWGQCRGTGHNHLGKILMKVRQSVRSRLLN